MQDHFDSKGQKRRLERRFKVPRDPLKVVIVRDMWLTGFDAPCCHTMYVDKPMAGHNPDAGEKQRFSELIPEVSRSDQFIKG